MKVVVVTGGIGSGKSVASRYLHTRYGWPIYEADARVKQLYRQHPTLLSNIEVSLGLSLRDQSGQFVPQLLAQVVFSDANALSKVENLVFPVLTEDFLQWKANHSDSNFGILESATILQKPQLAGIGDYIVLIDAPVDVRAQRAAERSGVSIESVLMRMECQSFMNDISDGVAESPADYMIENTGTLGDLEKNVDKLVETLL